MNDEFNGMDEVNDYYDRITTMIMRLRNIQNTTSNQEVIERSENMIVRLENMLNIIAPVNRYPETEGSIRIRDIEDEELMRDILEHGLHPDDYIHLFDDNHNYNDIPKEMYNYEEPPSYFSNLLPNYERYYGKSKRRTKGVTPKSNDTGDKSKRRRRRRRRTSNSNDKKSERRRRTSNN